MSPARIERICLSATGFLTPSQRARPSRTRSSNEKSSGSVLTRNALMRSTSADGGHDRNLGPVHDGRVEPAGVSDALDADEHVHVHAHPALLVDDTVANTGMAPPEPFERTADGRGRAVEVDSAPPVRVGPEEPGNP